ncbi:hypothetical protein ACFQJ7_07145 [Halovenus rubra]|uniref:Chemotaxis protein n=2 Tax=Halovenus rubra TaxID=869890 RepID=A0ABD5X5P1_9EURY|nr:hypothetical protein [Halovenus rubra]
MTGSDGADGGGVDDDVEDEDLDELHPVSSSLRTAQEQEGGTSRVVEADDGQTESKGSGGGSELDELAPVASGVRTTQSQPVADDLDAAGDDGDAGASDEESGGDD